jgi:putative ABC transport system permease protein
MTGVAIKGLMQRKVRALLTALAIVLGVAMVSGTFVLTDTIDKAFSSIFSSSYAKSDAVIGSKTVVEDSTSGKPTVSAELLERVKTLPTVETATGAIMDFTGSANEVKLAKPDGTTIGSADAPSFGIGFDPNESDLNPMTLVDGAWARGSDQVVIDIGAAKEHDIAVGDSVVLSAEGPSRTSTVTGLARFGDTESLGGATLAIVDVPTSRDLLDKNGFDLIFVGAQDGVSSDRLLSDITPLLPSTAEVQDGAAKGEADGKAVAENISFIRYFLLAFAGISLLVGAFVIFNTLSITVAQRTRELATLRSLGASRRQVMRMVTIEAFFVGLLASATGLGLGIALAKGLEAVFAAGGASMPQGDMVFATRTIVVSLLVGVLVTLAAGILPARRATRVAPIAAVREGAVVAKGRAARLAPVIAIAVTGLSAALLAFSLFTDGLATGARLGSMGLGFLGLVVGVAMVAPRLVRPLAAIVGWPAARLGGQAGRLARQNAVRNPSRTASTAAALMIGLALVTVVALLGAGLKDADTRALNQQLTAGYVVTSENGWTPLPVSVGERLTGLDTVETASSVRTDSARVNGEDTVVNGVDPDTIGGVYSTGWTAGSSATFASLGADEAVVSEKFSEDRDLAVGDELSILTPSGTTVQRTIAGVYDPPRLDPLLGEVLLSTTSFDAAFPGAKDAFTLVAAPEASATSIAAGLSAFPDATVQTRGEFVDQRIEEFTTFLNLLYILLTLSVIVSLFGMVNTLVLSVFERTREIGMLRAVGMTRRQLRRMIRHESVITALIGAALGLPLGIGISALVTQAMGDWGVELAIPTGTLAVFVIVAIVAGIVSATVPARRAARLQPLEALHYE